MLTDRLFLAVSAGKLVSVVGLMLMPVQVGAMLDGLQLGEGSCRFSCNDGIFRAWRRHPVCRNEPPENHRR